jgi:hypothetical protein
MRTGYAAFVLGNYSESLKQYGYVYDQDHDNKVALYYSYLDNLYLNNITAARFYASKMDAETRTSEKLQSFKLSGLNLEFCYKSPDISERGDAQYGRMGLNVQLGYRLELQQAGAFFSQKIDEVQLRFVNNNHNINIQQKEYYGKLIFAATGRLSLLGGFHYLYTPFNNFVYNNYIGFAGVKFSTPYVHVQGLGQLGRLRDTSYGQLDVVLTTYPKGNTDLYTITRVGAGKNFALTQVAGIRIFKKTWLEGNITLGKYDKLLGNDALYVFDDIDTKKFKAGGSLYYLLGKKVMVVVNYNYEMKQRYSLPNVNYNQYSITGGLQCNF